MAKKKIWNPQYTKTWVRTALQNELIKNEPYGLTAESHKLIKAVLQECDKKALEKQELDKVEQVNTSTILRWKDNDRGLSTVIRPTQ